MNTNDPERHELETHRLKWIEGAIANGESTITKLQLEGLMRTCRRKLVGTRLPQGGHNSERNEQFVEEARDLLNDLAEEYDVEMISANIVLKNMDSDKSIDEKLEEMQRLLDLVKRIVSERNE